MELFHAADGLYREDGEQDDHSHLESELEHVGDVDAPEAGQRRVQPFFIGLVEPSFEPEAKANDVKQLAALTARLVSSAKIEECRNEVRERLARCHERQLAAAEALHPLGIDQLITLYGDALSALEPNFALVQKHSGDIAGFADLLVRHSLYNKLYG